MVFEAMFFDLDDTLYPPTSGIWDAIGVRIEKYMQEEVHLPVDQIHTLRKDLWHQYGTTMRGLVELYQVDEEEYLEYVHDVDLAKYLQPDEALRQTLCLYPQRKLIFTNASKNHAQRVINHLGLDGIFDQIIDIQSIHPFCKPQKEAFESAFNLAGIHHPQECVLIDDSQLNLHVAQQLGMFAVRVGVEECSDGVDAAILSLHDLPAVIPVLGE